MRASGADVFKRILKNILRVCDTVMKQINPKLFEQAGISGFNESEHIVFDQ